MEESDKNKIKKEKKVGWKKKSWNIMNINREKKKVSKKEYTGAFWAAHVSELFPIVFFPFWKENPGRKTPKSHHIFFNSPPNTH